ncbi:hypothetical protein CONLIGDRAFT_293399 [Coniochaeta ligniaria NRRL 30616]|uniref:Uncharacterized protein n=1 Tax=Coniochaeta ligniaria NRRL 30616 TaxID=1408157 RepID=A0A1J7ITR3_9PEZI|nr:hypothetical protein CONLIGDRAFT_293399 [Coniochaeta ligniaria NRRL 30616]
MLNSRLLCGYPAILFDICEERLFILEPKFRYRQLCREVDDDSDENCPQSPVDVQEIKKQLAGVLQLGLDGLASTFQPAGDLLNVEETKMLTPARYQAQLDTVLQNHVPHYFPPRLLGSSFTALSFLRLPWKSRKASLLLSRSW